VRTARNLLVLVVIATLLTPAIAQASPTPRASLPDIEDEVMCPVCGTLLELAQSPQADRERVFIRKLIARGETKQQIKNTLVAEYGRDVLATPKGSGFDLAAYLVPIAAFVVGALALVVGVRRWRRSGEADQSPTEVQAPRGEDAERLDSDLARYDL
jgi:cytochrome c-type biogenesis protein CcmH